MVNHVLYAFHKLHSHSVYTQKYTLLLYIASCLPFVPEQGTVGASGDLAPLSHLTLGLMERDSCGVPPVDGLMLKM